MIRLVLATVALALAAPAASSGGASERGSKVALGKLIFFDENLSQPRGQSCASCHDPDVGFTAPDSSINAKGAVMPGAVHSRFGNRKPPSAAYATPSPVLSYDPVEGLFLGGVFWDGRATGWTLGLPAAEQALGPFLNPVEQNLPSKAEVLHRICAGSYGELFRKVWGKAACDPSFADVAYNYVGLSVAAFEDSPFVNRYSSKFDRVLGGKERFTWFEQKGFEVFAGKGNCSACHVLEPADRPLFTDNTFDNLGIPKNPLNPVYRSDPSFSDEGLGAFLTKQEDRPDYKQYAGVNLGKQRVPTLRNVDKRPYRGFVKAYGHNGYFKSLEQIVHFYNTRDVLRRCPDDYKGAAGVWCWPVPEYEATVNRSELGNLGLTLGEEAALVAFLKTLSDD